jgi:hypothetical protein
MYIANAETSIRNTIHQVMRLLWRRAAPCVKLEVAKFVEEFATLELSKSRLYVCLQRMHVHCRWRHRHKILAGCSTRWAHSRS